MSTPGLLKDIGDETHKAICAALCDGCRHGLPAVWVSDSQTIYHAIDNGQYRFNCYANKYIRARAAETLAAQQRSE